MTTRVTLLGWLDANQHRGSLGRGTGRETRARDDDSGPVTKARGEDFAPEPTSTGVSQMPGGQPVAVRWPAETKNREDDLVTAVRGET